MNILCRRCPHWPPCEEITVFAIHCTAQALDYVSHQKPDEFSKAFRKWEIPHGGQFVKMQGSETNNPNISSQFGKDHVALAHIHRRTILFDFRTSFVEQITSRPRARKQTNNLLNLDASHWSYCLRLKNQYLALTKNRNSNAGHV